VRTEGWRYIRYENGDEELYNEKADENEWTNLAGNPEFAAKKAELAKLLPTKDHADIGGRAGKGAEVGDEPPAKKARRKKAE
jgi:iduronate 2-sulfatase